MQKLIVFAEAEVNTNDGGTVNTLSHGSLPKKEFP